MSLGCRQDAVSRIGGISVLTSLDHRDCFASHIAHAIALPHPVPWSTETQPYGTSLLRICITHPDTFVSSHSRALRPSKLRRSGSSPSFLCVFRLLIKKSSRSINVTFFRFLTADYLPMEHPDSLLLLAFRLLSPLVFPFFFFCWCCLTQQE